MRLTYSMFCLFYGLSLTPLYGNPNIIDVSTVSRAPSSPSSPPAAKSYSPPPSNGGTIGRVPSNQSPGTVNRVPAPAPSQPTPGTVSRVVPGQPTPGSVPAVKPLPPNEVSRTMARGQSASALSAFKTDQARSKLPPVATPQTTAQAKSNPVWGQYGNRWHSADQYYSTRNTYISSLPVYQRTYWSNPPTYVVVRPSYGPYSAAMWGAGIGLATGAIIDIEYTKWYYAHRNDPAYNVWHQDMMEQAANNPELAAKMASLDHSIDQMQESGTVVNENYLPPNVDPSLAVSPDLVMLATSSEESHKTVYWVTFIVLLSFCILWFVFARRRIKYT